MKKLITLLFIISSTLALKAQCNANFGYQTDPMTGVSYFNGYASVNDSASYPITYVWSFGDGTSGTGQYLPHTYAYPGSYIVCLSIQTANGCSSTFCDSVYSGTPTSQCMANYTYLIDSINNVSYTYSFLDYSNPDNSSTIVSYNWSFGDSTYSTAQNPIHTFYGPGTYWVCLNIVTSSGCSNTSCGYITVGNACQIYASLTTQNPTTVGGSDGYIETNVYGGTPPYAYLWSTGQTTADIYNLTSGYYSLNITDANGCSNSYTAVLFEPNDSTNGQIIDTLYTNIIDTCLNFIPDSFYIATVTVDPSTNIVTVVWTFTGSGTTSTLIATYSYTYNGNNIVVLTISCGTKSITNYYASIHISTTTEVAPIYGNEQDVFAYPVPFNEKLNVVFTSSKTSKLNVSLIDATGRVVLSKKVEVSTGINSTEINTTSLPSGVYILNVENNGQTTHKQVVK
jgi:PKD repeat protein